jgi:hypothetical protein
MALSPTYEADIFYRDPRGNAIFVNDFSGTLDECMEWMGLEISELPINPDQIIIKLGPQDPRHPFKGWYDLLGGNLISNWLMEPIPGASDDVRNALIRAGVYGIDPEFYKLERENMEKNDWDTEKVIDEPGVFSTTDYDSGYVKAGEISPEGINVVLDSYLEKEGKFGKFLQLDGHYYPLVHPESPELDEVSIATSSKKMDMLIKERWNLIKGKPINLSGVGASYARNYLVRLI